MRRHFLFFLGLASLVLARKRLLCWVTGHSVGRRQFIGGHRCESCGAPVDAERVNPARKVGPRGLDPRFYRRGA